MTHQFDVETARARRVGDERRRGCGAHAPAAQRGARHGIGRKADQQRCRLRLFGGAGEAARCRQIDGFRRSPDFDGHRAERRAAQRLIAGSERRHRIASPYGQDRARVRSEGRKAGRIDLAEFAGRHVLPDPDDLLSGCGAQHHAQCEGRGGGAVIALGRIDLMQPARRQPALKGLVHRFSSKRKPMFRNGKTATGADGREGAPQVGKGCGVRPGHLLFLVCSYNTLTPEESQERGIA